MENKIVETKILGMIRRYDMLSPGDTVTVALSGGADSVALLYALYLLRPKLDIRLEALHFNHGLRGEESDRDARFARELCEGLDIPIRVVRGRVEPKGRGLEAAAREARYREYGACGGKVATAHTANDNAETVLMHMVRGTGLKGLGGIAPLRGKIIRPMLGVTRQEVLEFLQENFLRHVEDSSNASDDFFRNRLRHHVMPALYDENPRLAENLSEMAQRLRLDEELLAAMTPERSLLSVAELRTMHPALRYRALERFLRKNGVTEPEADHIALVEKLVFSQKPSAKADLPGGVTIGRRYDTLERLPDTTALEGRVLPCPGALEIPELGLWVRCEPCGESLLTTDCFTVASQGPILVRSRQSGDEIRLSGGTKRLKKLFIDCKIPASRRDLIPVLCDDRGVLGVWGAGANLDRTGPGVKITFCKNPER